MDVVVGRLSALPSSPAVEELRARAAECLRETDIWRSATPSTEETEELMKRVLALHVEAAKIEREGR